MLQELTEEIEKTARAVVNEIHTAMPGEIVSYDAETGLASVRPIGSYVTSDGKSLSYPVIADAPVSFPCCQDGRVSIAFPLKKGDGCIIVVSETELDEWRSGAEAEGSLRFDLTSAMVIPGLLRSGSRATKVAADEDAVVVAVGETRLAVSESGVTIKGDLTVSGEIKDSF